MASVNWEKIHKSGELKAILRHNDRDCRIKDQHSNEHINKDVTSQNLQTCDYAKACERYDKYIEQLDAKPKANKRKDRVTAIGLEIPIPNEIPDERISDYTKDVNAQLIGILGANDGKSSRNFVASYVHVDEVHDYIDATTNQVRTSMRHIHTYIIPDVGGKLNCDAIYRKGNLVKVNKAVDKMSREKYGVAFLTGEKSKSKDSVEHLKLESWALELDKRELEVSQREESVAYDKRAVANANKIITQREKAVAQRERDVEAYDRVTHRMREEAEKTMSEAKNLMEEAKRQKMAAQQLANDAQIRSAQLLRDHDAFEEEKQEYELDFRRRVMEEAEHIVERQRKAEAQSKEYEKQNERATMAMNRFGINE